MSNISATPESLGAKAVSDEAILEFRESIRGEVISITDESYEQARKLWNGMIDRFPRLIVRPTGSADVVHTVRFAREHGANVSVKGGGHNVAGTAVCDGGVMIDLSRMRSVRVDAERQTVRAGGGALLGDIDHESQALGLAVPVGVVSATGIGGLALHGGMGFLTRKYGLTSDNLVSADVVTADGSLIAVDEKRHPDLFWALRGGGGNFGIVTSFEFRAYPVGPMLPVTLVMYPVEKAGKVLPFFRDFINAAPDDLNGIALYWNAPEEEPIPEAYRGAPVIILLACYLGPLEEAESAMRPLKEIDRPLVDLIPEPIPYIVAQQLFDPDYPNGRRYYWKSIWLDELTDEIVGVLSGHAAARPSPITSLDVWMLGGAFSRVSDSDTAFPHRSSPYLVGIEANWDDPDDDTANIEWAREVFRDLHRFSSGGAYLNFPGFGEEGQDLMRRSYQGNYARLQAVKAKYDPDNFFRSNLNIQPAG